MVKRILSCDHTYNEFQIEWFKAGSALNLIKKQNRSQAPKKFNFSFQKTTHSLT